MPETVLRNWYIVYIYTLWSYNISLIIHIWPHIFMRNIPDDQCIWVTKGVTFRTFKRFWCVVSCRLKYISLSALFVKQIPQIKNYHQADVFFTCLLQGSKIDSWEHQSGPSLVHQPPNLRLPNWGSQCKKGGQKTPHDLGPQNGQPCHDLYENHRNPEAQGNMQKIWSLNTIWYNLYMNVCVCDHTVCVCHSILSSPPLIKHVPWRWWVRVVLPAFVLEYCLQKY